MRIAFILKGYPRVSETFIAQEIHLLEQRGFDIEIFSMRKAREPQRQPINEKIKARVTYLPEYIWPSLGTVLVENFSAFRFAPWTWVKHFTAAGARSLLKWDDDPIKRFLQAGWIVGRKKLGRPGNPVGHLHAHFAHAPTELTWAIARLTGLKFSISAHAKDIYTIPRRDLARRVRASELIMTCTSYNHRFLLDLPGVAAEKVHRVYHGIDLDTFRPAEGLTLNEGILRRFVSVGRLVPKKGYEDIFRALSLLRSRGHDFSYDIYGAGELEGALKDLARALSLGERVHFHKTATHPRIIERFRQGGLFLCGSRLGEDGDRDGIPNTLAEAMAMELPVIATNVSGIPELVEPEVSGLLVPERRPDLFAQAIERVLADPAFARDLGQNARKKVTEVFNAQVWIESCDRLLRPFMKGGHRD